jgi:hypothetical protein
MKGHRIQILFLVGALTLACSCPLVTPGSSPLAPSTGPGTPTDTPQPGAPAFTPTPTLTPTPGAPQLTPISSSVNCRSGPDVAYNITGVIQLGQVALIAGRNDDSSWWYVHDPNNPGQFCWVAASVVTPSGDLSNLPVIPITTALVTAVTVDASVNFNMCGGPNSAEFSGTLTTNGPVKVTFRWEVGGAVSSILGTQTITFKAAGTKSAPGPGALAHVDCGKYSITLHVLSPNDISAKKNFKIGP